MSKRHKGNSRPGSRKSVLLKLGWYVQEIVVGVANYAREAGWILEDLPTRVSGVPHIWKGDGIITLLADRHLDGAVIEMINRSKVPVVDLSDQLPELPYPRVLPDNQAIGQMVAEHFLGRGFTHFAFFTVARDAPVVRERLAAFRARTKGVGRSFHLLDFTDQIRKSENAGGEVLSQLAKKLAELPKPVAAMAQYDREALDIVRAAQLAGLDVPGDVAVAGVDNDPIYCELGVIPLSSVVSNREAIGYQGAALLDRLMRGERPPDKPVRIKPTGFIVRKSSDILAVDDVHIRKAMNYIAAHYHEQISVADVVAESGASRRSLYLKFEAKIGHTIHNEILRQRLDRAKLLLRDTDEKLEWIAREAGFEDAGALGKSFRHNLGLTTSEFRAMQCPRNNK